MDIQTGQTLTGFIFLIGGQDDTGQDDTGQDDTGQDDTGQDDTGQDDTGQGTGRNSVRGTGNRERYLRGSPVTC